MSFIAVMVWRKDGRVAKFAEFKTEAEAQRHARSFAADYPEAFVVTTPSGRFMEWRVADGSLALDPPAPTVDQIRRERDRRLAVGFDYNFRDARAIHRIATDTEDVCKAAEEVTPLASSLVMNGDTETTIAFKTETGRVDITGPEWLSILLAAAEWRQPIFQAYFDLTAMDPIPSDYTDDKYWP